MVRYLPQLSVVQQSHRFVRGGGEAGGCCFDFKVLCIKLPLNCCHHNACEPVCCVSLTGTNPRKYCPLSSPHSCLCVLKAGMDSGTLPDLQADKTFQTKPRKDNQGFNTSGFNFAPTFSGEKQVCFSIIRLLKLPERQIANKHPLATSTELYVVVCHLFLRLVLIFSLSSFDS